MSFSAILEDRTIVGGMPVKSLAQRLSQAEARRGGRQE